MFQPAEFSTTLASSATAGATSFAVASATGLPAITAGDVSVMRLDDGAGAAENVLVTAISGTTVTCAALANSHSSGASVKGAVINTAALAQIKRDALAMGPEVAVAASATATLGKMHRCAPTSADITLTIPNGAVEGDMVSVRVGQAATKLVTLATSAGIDGATSRVMWKGESAYLRWDSANATWTKVAGRTIPMIGVIKLVATGVTVPSATATAVALDTAVSDNTGAMVETANHGLRVKRVGTYSLLGGVSFKSLSSNLTALIAYPTLNGATYAAGCSGNTTAASDACAVATVPTAALAANDLMTLQVFQGSGGSQTLSTDFYIALNFLSLIEQPSW